MLENRHGSGRLFSGSGSSRAFRLFNSGSKKNFGLESGSKLGANENNLTLFVELKPDAVVIDLDLGAGPNGIDLANKLRNLNDSIGIVLLTAFLNPTQLPMQIAKLPPKSRYLIKHSVSEIQVLLDEINLALIK